MKLLRFRSVLLVLVAAFAAFYVVGAIMFSRMDRSVPPPTGPLIPPETIAIFGASGTAGDGILEAALADPKINEIHVITRRTTQRMQEGVAAGRVQVWTHTDYLDYEAVHAVMAEVGTVYWAIGISSRGVDEETYGRIHVDFPVRFVTEWLDVSERPQLTFHYISSSDISADSSMMWAREKVRAERSLFSLAAGTHLQVIAYRPDYIGPTDAEAHLGQKLLYGFFSPVGAAVKATQIGQAMLEVSARPEFENGEKLNTLKILKYSDAYRLRRGG